MKNRNIKTVVYADNMRKEDNNTPSKKTVKADIIVSPFLNYFTVKS